MSKIINLILCGVTLIMSGVVMLVSDSIGISLSKILIPILFIVAGIFAILFANANRGVKITYQYHAIQGVIFILFGLIIGFGADSLDVFLKYSTYFILILGLFDISYGFALVNSDFKWSWGKLLFKAFGGFLAIIGGVAILATSVTDQYSGLMITGVMTIIIGLGTIDFARKIKSVST